MNWYLKVLKNYVGFGGRARRKEYWFYVLFNCIISFGIACVEYFAGIFNMETGYGPISALYSLGVLIPSLAVSVRRLHDINRSGWWLLIGVVPCIGWLLLLVWDCKEGDSGPNRFGSDPKAEAY